MLYEVVIKETITKRYYVSADNALEASSKACGDCSYKAEGYSRELLDVKKED